MTSTIVNLALFVVTADVDEFLNTNPNPVPSCAVPSSAVRQMLVAYVLTRIPGLYALTDDIEYLAIDPTLLYSSNERQQQISTLIRQGIRQIRQDGVSWMTTAERSLYSTHSCSIPSA